MNERRVGGFALLLPSKATPYERQKISNKKRGLKLINPRYLYYKLENSNYNFSATINVVSANLVE